MEIIILLLLILVNGVLSMSEAAMISSRQARLMQRAERGDKGAETALKISEEPTRFLSTVQIGITLVGILSGAFGGATIATQIAEPLRNTSLAPYADAIGVALVVIATTYLSLIIGELVPKRLALHQPENIAASVARPMNTLSKITSPVVWLLSKSTEAMLVLLGVRASDDPPVTDEEIETLMRQGTEAGVFETGEHKMVAGVMALDETRADTIMTPRTELCWINLNDDPDEQRKALLDCQFSRLPVGDGDLDHVVGVLHAKAMLMRVMSGEPFDVSAAMWEPQFVPGSLPANKLIEIFRQSAQHFAVVVGEYGEVLGIVTMQDILKEIVGDVEEDAPQATQRDDGSWLIDGMMRIEAFAELLDLNTLEKEEDDHYETVGGFVMHQMEDIPEAGESFEWLRWNVEVVDMDGNRVDKVLVTELPPPSEDENEPEIEQESEKK